MTIWNTPQIGPYYIPKSVGTGVVKSKYLINYYDTPYTAKYWRDAIDRAINYSDLYYYGVLQSWAIQSSPFLVSLLDKRYVPAQKNFYALAKYGEMSRIDDKFSKYFTQTNIFKQLVCRAPLNAKIRGVAGKQIDIEKDIVTDFPMRNIDMFNRAIRYMTFDIQSVAKFDDYDNMFYFEASPEEDYKLGLMQEVTRAIIEIVNSYRNWGILTGRYSYPRYTIGYQAQNEEAQQIAVEYAGLINDPTATPVVPFEVNELSTNKERKYQVEINSVNTEAPSEAFRAHKELVDKWESELMQLITGSTLIGNTEKNTNSEQLAEIHMQLYKNILDEDNKDILRVTNTQTMPKLARLVKNKDLTDYQVVIIPDKSISVKHFIKITDTLSKQGLRISEQFLQKVGLDEGDIDKKVTNKSWITNTVDKIKSIFTPKSKKDGGYDAGYDKQAQES